MKTIVHVDQHAIRRNTKTGSEDPIFTVKTYKENLKTSGVAIVVDGREIGRFVYSDSPLSCGARAWFEFDTNDGVSAEGF